ncbi:MAG: hypothetical protein M1836_001867 [Candelina mexicana]|nr:MAG: hypothetical protein M1836_001867 [Candelina mexicana]
MTLSLSHFPVLTLYLLCFGIIAQAATVTYDFNITWVLTNPDGAFEKPTIGINGQWPLPHITANVGDRVVVNVTNHLGNQSTSLHFHGLYQNGTPEMDGAVGASQCAIPPGSSFTYDFKIKQPGTYWYHSHNNGQYPDGLRGALIVHDPDSPYKDQYDEEIVLTLSDWYHDQMPPLIARFMRYSNPTGAEPVPDAALMNDTQNLKVAVQPGKTYLFRIINMAAFAAQYFWFEGHSMRIVEVDGIYTEPAEADLIYITAAQRYSLLVTAKNDIGSNFAFVGSMDQDLFDTVPKTLNPNVTGWLLYDEAKPFPLPALLDSFDPFDDFSLVPVDGMELLEHVDHSIDLTVKMDILGDGANYAFFNDITYVLPKVPTLYTALSTGVSATNAAVYGVNTHAFVLQRDETVQIILNNDDPGKHPFHLHGHAFQVVSRSEEEAGAYNGTGSLHMPKIPMRRDVVLVRPNGNVVLRFKADNPDKSPLNFKEQSSLLTYYSDDYEFGYFIAISSGMSTLKSTKLTGDHVKVCKELGLPTEGNAAGNTIDFLDLTGANKPPAPLPAGFTSKGIVALVFSTLSAFLGIAVIAWYGVGDLGPSELASAKNYVAAAGDKK